MVQPQMLPRCLAADVLFEHKSAIVAALHSGTATIRCEERLVPAESHYAIYSIRLGLARDSKLARGYEEEAASAAKNIEVFLSNLERDLTALTRAWHVRADDGRRFTIVESEATGEVLGVLFGRTQAKGGAVYEPEA